MRAKFITVKGPGSLSAEPFYVGVLQHERTMSRKEAYEYIAGQTGYSPTAGPDGDGLTTAQEYIAGTDPTDPDSKFSASIEMVDGKPVVTYSPDLLSERKYKKLGKRDIGDPDEEWSEVNDGEEGDYNFFKITVDMP